MATQKSRSKSKKLADTPGEKDAIPSPKKVVQRARDVAREARGLLKAKAKKVAKDKADRVQAAFDAVVQGLPARRQPLSEIDHEGLHKATRTLDTELTDVFGRWRKTVAREYLESIVWAIGLAFLIRAFIFEAFSIPSSSMMPTLKIGDHLFVNKIGYGLYVPFNPSRFLHWDEPTRGDIIVFEYRFPGARHDGEDFIKRVIGVPGDRVRVEDNQIILNDEAIPTEAIDPKKSTDGFNGICGVYKHDDSDQTSGQCHCTRQVERLGPGDDRSEWSTSYTSQHFHPGHGCTEPTRPDWDLDDVRPFEREFFRPPACRRKTTDQLGSLGRRIRESCLKLYNDGGNLVVPDGHVFVMGDNRDQSDDGRSWGLVPFDRIKGSAFFIWYAREFSRVFTWL